MSRQGLLRGQQPSLGPCCTKGLFTQLGACVRQRTLIASSIDRVHRSADGLAQRLSCSPELGGPQGIVLFPLQGSQRLQAESYGLFVHVILQQQGYIPLAEATGRFHLTLPRQQPYLA